MSNIHFGPPNKDEPFIDPEVWRKAISLVKRYKPGILRNNTIKKVEHWRHEIKKIDEYHYFDSNSIKNDCFRKYNNESNYWRIGEIICENIQIYASGNEDPFEYIIGLNSNSSRSLSLHFPYQVQSNSVEDVTWIKISKEKYRFSNSPIVLNINAPFIKEFNSETNSYVVGFPTYISVNIKPNGNQRRNTIGICLPVPSIQYIKLNAINVDEQFNHVNDRFIPILNNFLGLSYRFKAVRVYVNLTIVLYGDNREGNIYRIGRSNSEDENEVGEI